MGYCIDLSALSLQDYKRKLLEVLHEQVNRLSHEKNIYKGHIGLNDINIFIEASREVPLEIEY
ncbi:MAG: hypothetical protein ACOCXH_05025 [Cyclobacteriaceae bacterium]